MVVVDMLEDIFFETDLINFVERLRPDITRFAMRLRNPGPVVEIVKLATRSGRSMAIA